MGVLVLCKLFQGKTSFILNIGNKLKLSRGKLKIYVGGIDGFGFIN